MLKLFWRKHDARHVLPGSFSTPGVAHQLVLVARAFNGPLVLAVGVCSSSASLCGRCLQQLSVALPGPSLRPHGHKAVVQREPGHNIDACTGVPLCALLIINARSSQHLFYFAWFCFFLAVLSCSCRMIKRLDLGTKHVSY